MTDGISLIIITYNRCDELHFTLETLKKQIIRFPYEILIIDQNSDDNTSEVVSQAAIPELRYIKLNENLGVAGGRNVGAKNAHYNCMVFIDDDAHFVENDGLLRLYQVMQNEKDRDMFAMQIFDKEGKMFHWPYGKKMLKHRNERFECSNYIGCGHALRKERFDQLKGYNDKLFFGFEESELIMKAYARDAKPVLYDGSIQLVHRVTQTNRIPNQKRFFYKYRNRMLIIRECHPCKGGFYALYYVLGYFVDALKNKMLPQLFSGINAANKFPVNREYRMSYKNFFRYLKYRKGILENK